MDCLYDGSSGLSQQLGEVVVDAGRPEIRLPLEWLPYVVHPVIVIPQKLDNGEDVVLGLVQRVENLVAGDQDIGRTADSLPLTSMNRSLPVPGTRLSMS